MSTFDVSKMVEGIQAGDKLALSRGITLVESTRSDHEKLAATLLKAVTKDNSLRAKVIAITGAPGVGKSSLIESLGQLVSEKGSSMAVLAIDPTSHRTGGSILGDKTRMASISKLPNVFIRPSPNVGQHGGLGTATLESVLLCEAAGYTNILIETVGVGQAEVEARYICDLLMVLVQPGAGDELQGIKRGILEEADLLVITKNDRELGSQASLLHRQLTVLHPNVPVMLSSILDPSQIKSVWRKVIELHGRLDTTRLRQNALQHWLKEKALTRLCREIEHHVVAALQEEKAVQGEYLGPYLDLVEDLFDKFSRH